MKVCSLWDAAQSIVPLRTATHCLLNQLMTSGCCTPLHSSDWVVISPFLPLYDIWWLFSIRLAAHQPTFFSAKVTHSNPPMWPRSLILKGMEDETLIGLPCVTPKTRLWLIRGLKSISFRPCAWRSDHFSSIKIAKVDLDPPQRHLRFTPCAIDR